VKRGAGVVPGFCGGERELGRAGDWRCGWLVGGLRGVLAVAAAD
jgi:hypothetical protein